MPSVLARGCRSGSCSKLTRRASVVRSCEAGICRPYQRANHGARVKGKGTSVDETKAAILADNGALALRATITGRDAQRNDAFALYLVDWFVRRVSQELDGTLEDSIPRVPRKSHRPRLRGEVDSGSR